MKTVHEVSRLTGVSIRALHHYDSMGLLKPAMVTEAGYRMYDDASLTRLHEILIYRELGFSLGDIGSMLDSPSFDRQAALSEQLVMLERQKERIEKMIKLTEEMIKKGTYIMDFEAFDKKELEAYAEEAKKRWSGTPAYDESEKRAAGRTPDTQKQLADGLTDIFCEFGKIKDSAPSSENAQSLVKKLQCYITDNYYTCTGVILSGLGEMYVGDERFMKNIDSAAGEGTARFVSSAIKIYCEKNEMK